MKSVYIHIDELLRDKEMNQLRDELMHIPHVTNVELSTKNPHYVTVEFEAHHSALSLIQQHLHNRGLHTDVTSC